MLIPQRFICRQSNMFCDTAPLTSADSPYLHRTSSDQKQGRQQKRTAGFGARGMQYP
jgi:hypothetical protein